jgi:hypothetical protein
LKNKKDLSRSQIKKCLKKWDRNQGGAMAHAKSIIAKLQKPYSFSPTLQNVGLIYKYWRMRHREEKTHKDYTATVHCIKQLVKKSNPRFSVLLRGATRTLEQVTTNLNEAAMHVRQCQKNSNELQFKSHNNILAKHNTNNNLLTKKASEEKAAAVWNIICSEECRITYSNISNVVKPTTFKGLQNHMIP